MTQQPLDFDGPTFDAATDGARLTGQLHRVLAVMQSGEWRTLREISALVRGSEAGVSARLRDLRKPRFGGRVVERRRRCAGLWEYRVGGNAR